MSNDETLEGTTSKSKLLLNISKKQWKFLGHVMRKVSLENIIHSGKIKDKRKNGKLRIMYMSSLRYRRSAWERQPKAKIVKI